MKQFFYLFIICVVTLSSCTNETFKKGGDGLEYKIISGGSGKKVSYGNYIQLHYSQVYKGTRDSLIADSRDFMPRINIFDSVSTPLAYYNILRQLRIGDSLVLRTRVDSFYKRDPSTTPANMKKSDFVYTSLKIVNFFESKAQADSANKAEFIKGRPRMFAKQLADFEKEMVVKNKAQIDEDGKTIAAYLSKNNITATKTNWGTYIAMSAEGTGELIGPADVVSVNYTGKTLDSGKVIDSNTDPKFKHVVPLDVTIIQLGEVMLGWTDALLHMKKGSKATVFIPSSIAYGKEGRSPGVGPDKNLMFEMEVVNVEKQEDILARQEEKQRQMVEAQKRMSDSLNNAQPKNK